jgi:hypothetical protein
MQNADDVCLISGDAAGRTHRTILSHPLRSESAHSSNKPVSESSPDMARVSASATAWCDDGEGRF